MPTLIEPRLDNWWRTLLVSGMAIVAATIALSISWSEVSLHLRQQNLNAMARAVQEVQKSLLRCQTGLRGYVITGDERFLEPYELCRTAVPEQLQRLTAVAAKCDLVPERRMLATWVEAVMTDLGETLSATQGGRRDAVATNATMLTGKSLMDEANATFAVVVRQVDTELQKVDENLNRLHNFKIAVLIAGLAVSMVLLWQITAQSQWLAARLAFQRALWDSSGDALFLFDLDTGEMVDTNPSGERLIGSTKSDIIGRPWTEFVPAEELARSARHVAQVSSDPQPLRHGHLIARDGRKIPAEGVISREVHLDGRRLAVSSFRSLQEREAALNEIALREAIEKSLPSGIACIDDYGVQTHVNERLCQMVGWRADELIGHPPPFPYWPPEEHERIRRIFQDALAGNLTGPVEVMLMRRSGERFPAEFLVARIQHPTHPGWLANVMDITERKARQRELETARHLEGLGKLSRQVAHDFNNLLSIVMINVSLARQSAHQSDQLAQLEAITAAAQRGRDIVASLIAMAREHPLEGKLLELSEIIREAEPLYTTVCGASRTISFIYPDSPVWITADRGQLDATLLNLVVNARDATAPNGKITVCVDTRNVGPGDKFRKPGSYAVIEVSDTGHGMSPEVRQRAFEPFFSTKGAQGAGLGLATVSGFAHQCGGDVEIESTEGVGTTIRIVLPIASPQADSTPKPITRNAQPKRRILLVDDEPALLHGLAKLLVAAGNEVSTALDGPTALTALAERAFDVLISDIRMPGMSGTELAEQVSARHPEVAILLMSGLRPDKVKPRWPIVEKPIDIESLLAAIDRHQLHPA